MKTKIGTWYPLHGSETCKTSDIVCGDIVEFSQNAVYRSKSGKIYWGDSRVVRALVLRESYGAEKAQHTYTLQLLDDVVESRCCVKSIGSVVVHSARRAGEELRIKGRNLYRGEPRRRYWKDETLRDAIRDEKHERGHDAKAAWAGLKELREKF